jgi:hypothetical protein
LLTTIYIVDTFIWSISFNAYALRIFLNSRIAIATSRVAGA